MGRPKISFAVGKKRKASELITNPTAPAQGSASSNLLRSSSEVISEAVAVPPEDVDPLHHKREASLAKAHELSKSAPGVTAPTDPVSKRLQSGATPKAIRNPQQLGSSPVLRESKNMAEPPAKRAKRTDSSAMWDRNERPPRPPLDRDTKDAASGRDRRDDRDRDRDRDRGQGRDDRRHRSRSRNRVEKRRERSRSRERDGGRSRNGDKGRDGGNRKDRERSTSRERHRPRRGRSSEIPLSVSTNSMLTDSSQMILLLVQIVTALVRDHPLAIARAPASVRHPESRE